MGVLPLLHKIKMIRWIKLSGMRYYVWDTQRRRLINSVFIYSSTQLSFGIAWILYTYGSLWAGVVTFTNNEKYSIGCRNIYFLPYHRTGCGVFWIFHCHSIVDCSIFFFIFSSTVPSLVSLLMSKNVLAILKARLGCYQKALQAKYVKENRFGLIIILTSYTA